MSDTIDKELFRVIKSKPDGNCFYNSISYLMCGNQFRYATSLRHAVCKEYDDNNGRYYDFEPNRNKICDNFEYTDEMSVNIISNLFNCTIYIYKPLNKTKYELTTNKIQYSTAIIYLLLKNVHFDVLEFVDDPNTTPLGYMCKYFDSEVIGPEVIDLEGIDSEVIDPEVIFPINQSKKRKKLEEKKSTKSKKSN